MVYILGGNGFVGSGFVRYCQLNALPFQVIDRENYDSFIGTKCDLFINANGNSKKFVAKNDPKNEFLMSVASVRNSLVDFNFGKYIFLSTSDVYPDCSLTDFTVETGLLSIQKQSPYGFHKYLAELCVQHSASDWLILRQGGFVGPGMKKNPVYDVLFGDKVWVHQDSEFQFISTDDSAALIMSLIDQGIGRKIFNLTSTGTISVKTIMNLAGRDVAFMADASPVRYEISTESVSKYLKLPNTVDTVSKFLAQISKAT